MKEVRFKIPLTEVVWFQEGPGVRNTQYTQSGVKLLNVANLVDGKIDLSTSDRYISEEEAYGKYKHFLADDGDLIIASSGIKVEYIDKKIGFIHKEHLPLCMNTSTIRFKVIDEQEFSIKYFMYFLKSREFKRQLFIHITGCAQLNFGPSHLKKMYISYPPLPEQSRIVEELDLLSNIIEKKRQQLSEFDNLAQSIFYDMFGDPVTNEKGWEVKPIVELYELKAGKAIKANELHNYYGEGLYRCYGGNGIRGYIAKCSHSGIYPIIGRQGALCGNVNLAKGDFYATEHAVVVSSKENNDMIWTYYCMSIMNLNKYAKGVAQPGISVNVINGVNIIHPSFHLQQLFAQKIEAIEKEKVLIKQSIKETEELFNSRMDYYFI